MLFFHFDYLADATIDLSMDKIVLLISNSFYWFKIDLKRYNVTHS